MFEHSTTPTRGRITGRILTGVLAVALSGYTLPPATAADSPPPPTAPAAVAAVAVSAPATPAMLAPLRTMTTTVYFATGSARVSPASRTALSRFVRSLPKTAFVVGVQVRGYVQGSPTTRNNKALSHARAANVAAWLTALHLPGRYTLTSGGVAGNSVRARRAVVTITYRLRTPQAITFTQPEGVTVGDSNMPLTATSTSGLLVTLTSLTPAVCTVVARTAHAVSAGTCALRATQSGAAYVLPATAVTRTFAVAPARFTVTYDANGGVVDPTSAVFTSGGSGLILPDPSRTSYVFDGWFTAAVAGTQMHTPYVPTGATTLYAQWTATHSVVTYNLNYLGAAAPTTDNFTYPTPVSLPSAARAHYTFAGWYDDPDAGHLVGVATDPYSPRADTTLWAHWTGEQFVVTYDLNYTGAPTAGTATFTYPTDLILPNETRAHYVFSGWYDAQSGGTLIGNTTDTYRPTAAIRLYAHWTPEQFVVTYNYNYLGSVDTTATFTYPTALTLPTPIRNEWAFQGWYTDPLAGTIAGPGGSSYSPASTTTLWAHWLESPAARFDVVITNNSTLDAPVDYCGTAPVVCSGTNVMHTTASANGGVRDLHVYANTTNVTGLGQLSSYEIAITINPDLVDVPTLSGSVFEGGTPIDNIDGTQTLTYRVTGAGTITLSNIL